MEDIKNFLKKGKIKEALVKFRALSEAEQENFFREMVPTVFLPSLIAVLYRKLKPESTFEDFYEAWLPPLKKGQDLAHYFPFPAHAINAQNKDDPTDVISIGFMWGTETELSTLEKNVDITRTEKERHDKIERVAHKAQPTATYILKNITILGS
jgi:hypothetical protein